MSLIRDSIPSIFIPSYFWCGFAEVLHSEQNNSKNCVLYCLSNATLLVSYLKCIGELDDFDSSMAAVPDALFDRDHLGIYIFSICT